MDNFAEWLRNELKKSGLKQCFVADFVGICQPTMSDYVRGVKLPSIKTACDIARAFGKKIVAVEEDTWKNDA